MKSKGLFLALLLIFIFGASSFAFAQAMTEQQRQALILQIQAQIVRLQELVRASSQQRPWCYTFGSNISFGQSGADVLNLQLALQKEGFILSQNETQNQKFGDSTIVAVKGFQLKYASDILAPSGLVSATGKAGPATRDKLNQLYGCQDNCKSSWSCGEWTICATGHQTRTCTDTRNCIIPTKKPDTAQICNIVPDVDIKANELDGPINIFLKKGSGASVVHGGGIHLSANVNLKWVTTGVASCQASGSNKAAIFSGYKIATGSEVVTLAGDILTPKVSSNKLAETFTLSCVSTATAKKVTDKVSVNVFYTIDANCVPNWSCDSWGSCVSKKQTRACTDYNGCASSEGKPIVTQSCTR